MMTENQDDPYDIPAEPVAEPDTSQLPNVEELRSDAALATSGSSKRKRNLIILGVVLVVLAVIVGVSVGVSQSNKSESTDNQAARASGVVQFVISQGLSDSTAVDTAGSPQNLAVGFMAIGDEAQLDIPLKKTDPDAFQFIQRYALAVFYYSLGGESWDYGLNLMSKDDTCQWYETLESANYGAACDDEGHVFTLFIPGIGVKGKIPPEIGLLTSMVFFAVGWNRNVTGTIPEAFHRLSDLEFLILGGNALTGPIPERIGELTKLKWLLLYDNQLASTIPSSLSNLSDLDSLDLEVNALKGPIPEWIGELTNLTGLGLNENQLTSTLPSSLSNLKVLQHLSLDGNMLTGEIGVLESLTNLRFLLLEHNMLSQPIDETTLKNLTALEQLDLSDNDFFGMVPQHLLGLPALDVLDLSDNLLNGTLPEFPPNIALNFLFIHNCSLSGSIPDSIMNLSALNHLDLSENELNGEIPSAFGNLTDMIYLFLSINKFEPGPIPEFLNDMPNLRDLSLKETHRNGPIPSWFGTMKNLLLLDFHRNKLTGTIPPELANAPQLALVLLNRNRLNGTIPEELETMPNLSMLLLDNNTITGTTTSVCKARARGLAIFITDCGGENPEVICTGDCCTLCCEDTNETCNDGSLLARFDPIWEESYQRRMFNFSEDLVFVPVP